MVRKFGFFLLAVSTLFIAACSGNKFSRGAPQVVAAPDSVSAMLADAADRASTALQTLAAVEHEKTKTASLAPVNNAPTELQRAVTVSWIGPVETVTRTLADRASYNFQVIGNTPPVPIIVNLDVQNKPIIDVLRNIGLQLGLRANVKVDSSLRLVEIEYPPNTGS